MKRLIAAMLCGVSLLTGCGYMQSDLDKAYEQGYEAGIEAANSAGNSDFAEDVWNDGYNAGVEDGYYGATHGYSQDDVYGMWLGDTPED